MVFRSNRKIYALSYDETLFKIDNYVKSAVKCNGLAYGCYVRDIIVPLNQLKTSIHQLDCNNLNLWFKTEEDSDDFIEENKDQIKLAGLITNYFPYKTQYKAYDGPKLILIIEIVISNFYPVCDFSANLLSWNGQELKINKPYDMINPSKTLDVYYTLNDIIRQILRRCCYILPQFKSLANKVWIDEFSRRYKFFNY